MFSCELFVYERNIIVIRPRTVTSRVPVSEYKGKYTVPVLWDKQMNTMVNNKSKDILRMLNANFQEFCETDEQRQLDLYPSQHQEEIDDLTDFISPYVIR